MFVRLDLPDGRHVWQSTIFNDLGVRHAFTTRAWNIKQPADIRPMLDTLGWRGIDRVRLAKQVHGCTVTLPADDGAAGCVAPGREALVEADAHVTDRADEVVVVRTADCVPILLSGSDGRYVAAIHAGWRGLDPAVNVIGQAIATLRRRMDTNGGSDPSSATSAHASPLLAAVGPCIAAKRYEVGEEVAGRFRGIAAVREVGGTRGGREEDGCVVIDRPGEKSCLDLRGIAVSQLIAAGLEPQALDVYPGCTFDQADQFHSYRRDGGGVPGNVGHLAAVIAPRPA